MPWSCKYTSRTHMSRDMTKPTMWLCAQRRLRSAWASAQSDQSLRCLHEAAWVLIYPLSAQRRLWSDWADAQADLSLRWAHSHIVGFVMCTSFFALPEIAMTLSNDNFITLTESKWPQSFFSVLPRDKLQTRITPSSPPLRIVSLLSVIARHRTAELCSTIIWYMINEPPHDKTNEVTVRPAKTQISLGIRPVSSVFTVRMKKAWVLSSTMSAQQRLWSDWADAQADPSLSWAHIPLCWFCREAAQIKKLWR